MKKITQVITASFLVLGFGAIFATTSGVQVANAAEDLTLKGGIGAARGDDQQENVTIGSIFKTVTNILLFVIGAISVIMLIVGGIRYTISAGKQDQVTAAKNTILYSVVGLVVAFFAYAIVNWVLGSIGGDS